MKRVLLLGILAGLMFITNAQVIPNAGFENWDSNFMYENPTDYSTSNMYLYQYQLSSNVMKQYPAFSGNYSVWLETVDVYGTPTMAFMMYGDPSGIMSGGGINTIKGGFPYTQLPDSFVFYARHQCTHSDSAFVLVLLKKTVLGTSIPFSVNMYKLHGIQNSVKRYSFPVIATYPLVPDSAIIAFTSSNPMFQDSTTVGNWLEVDKISFVKKNGVTMPAIPNYDFENWDSVTDIEPQNWITTNSYDLYMNRPLSVLSVKPGKTGNCAVKITSNTINTGVPDTFGILGLGDQNSNNPGMALINNPDSLGFWYKYNNSKNTKDSAYSVVVFTKYNSVTGQSNQLDSSAFALGAATAFTYKTLRFPKIYGKSPDSIGIIFSSSKFTPTGRGIGNYLIIDDVLLWSHHVGIPVSSHNQSYNFVYPNPASSFVNVQFELNTVSDVNISLVDLSGRNVKTKEYKLSEGKQLVKLDLEDVADGQYLVVIGQGNNSIYSQRIVVRK